MDEGKPRTLRPQQPLRYPTDLTDEEWALIEPLIPPAKRGGNKRTVNLREVVNGLMYILSTGCQWRAIPKDLPPRSTLYDYFDLWSWDGTLDRIHHALYVECRERAEREASPTAAIIDSQSVKSAEKGGPHRSAWLRCGQEDQGQEAPYPRRHAGPADARHRACRRHSGSRRRRAADGDLFGLYPFLLKLYADGGYQGAQFQAALAAILKRVNVEIVKRSDQAQGLRRAAQTMDRRANLRLARTMPTARQGLGVPQSQGARLPQARFYPPHAAKAMQSKMMFPDRLLSLTIGDAMYMAQSSECYVVLVSA